MSRLPTVSANMVWAVLGLIAAVVMVVQKLYIALAVFALLILAIAATRRTVRGRAFTDRLKLPVLALLSAFLVGGIVLILSDLEFYSKLSANPLGTLEASFGRVVVAYWELLKGAFGDIPKISTALASGDRNKIGIAFRPMSETLLATTPLILTGLGVAIAFRSGVFNIGAEGQLKIGAVFGAWVGIWIPLPFPFGLILAIAAGVLGGALWAFIPGILKAKTGAHEVITTIMLNAIAQQIMLALLLTPILRPEGSTTPISWPILEASQLPLLLALPKLRVHWGLILALVAAVGTSWLMFRTTRGFEFRAAGLNPRAAGYAGMRAGRTIVLAMTVSGALAGLAGAVEVLGTNRYLSPGISPGYGWDAISIALLGGTRPLGVVIAAFLFGALRAGGQGMALATGVPIDLLGFISALVIMFVAAPRLVRELYRVRISSAAPQTPKVVETPV
ncbi:MAG: ABC transporter permease [Chloroflexi bacterium]|nr:ABC transporter permease [Chloroflexota bacterium]